MLVRTVTSPSSCPDQTREIPGLLNATELANLYAIDEKQDVIKVCITWTYLFCACIYVIDSNHALPLLAQNAKFTFHIRSTIVECDDA